MALEWTRALVTGASAGIGRAMAKKLADEGTELVLVARDATRLEELAASLPVAVEILPADLTNRTDLERVATRVAAIDAPVDLLVNNAGFGTHGRFHELPLDAELRQIDLNVVALVRLCHAAAPRMAVAGTGTILNVSSIAGASPGATLATYAATKAFVTSFTDSLHEELTPHGVRVCAVLPGLTRTEFHERSGYEPTGLPDLVWQSAEAVAAEGLAAAARNQSVAVTGWPNRVAMAATRLLPRVVTRRAARAVRE